MLNLNGIVPVETIHEIESYTDLRLRDKTKYKCAEALALYEQRLLSNEKIYELCERAEEEDLYIPAMSYIPDDIVRHFIGSNVVPVSFSPMRGVVTCVSLPELGSNYKLMENRRVEVVYTPIYNYFQEYVKKYGPHPDLLDMPARQLIDSIINEGIALDASDITISSVGKSANVYYNVRKNKVYSQRILSADNIEDIIKLLCCESPMDDSTNHPKYVGVSLNDYYRGRVCINHKYHGYEITIRLLPNAAFDKSLEDLNLTKETVKFFRDCFMNRELGLRLIVGSTMSGKNTTALACLREWTIEDKYKVVSIEMPVEQELEGVEQINCNDEEEYDLNINSLLRQNPDIVYITETGDTTATSIMRVTNTGKRVVSTLHANSCADVIGRLQDITNLSTDRIIQTLHSIVYQELVRDNKTDSVKPKNKFLYLSQDRKSQLYGKSYGEIILKLRQWEGGDIW
jgi:type II secretory ATPase GspE/PulE/Tfp pilus assembly ATPase PilB-like protein